MKRTNRRFGFTLVELMVVISVIAILAAITVAAAMKVRSYMRIRVARGSASRMGQALQAYQALRNFLPVHVLYDPETDGDADYQNYEIVRQLNGIMSRDKLLKVANNELNQYGSFKDPWGRPYRVIIWKQNASDTYYRFFQVYSCGENLQWEMGAGDDLTQDL